MSAAVRRHLPPVSAMGPPGARGSWLDGRRSKLSEEIDTVKRRPSSRTIVRFFPAIACGLALMVFPARLVNTRTALGEVLRARG